MVEQEAKYKKMGVISFICSALSFILVLGYVISVNFNITKILFPILILFSPFTGLGGYINSITYAGIAAYIISIILAICGLILARKSKKAPNNYGKWSTIISIIVIISFIVLLIIYVNYLLFYFK